jgi:hypothetical protein
MNNDDVEKELFGRLKKLDQADVKTPGLLFFTGLVGREKARIVKRQNRQFAFFIAVSVFIVAAVLLCLLVNFYLFAAVEAVPLIVFGCLYGRAHKSEAEHRRAGAGS